MEACCTVGCSRPVSLDRRDATEHQRARPTFSEGMFLDFGRGPLQRSAHTSPVTAEPARSRRRRSYHSSDSEARKELLEILQCKDKGELTPLPDVLTISPPSRSGNPLVKDGNFLRQPDAHFSNVQPKSRSVQCRVAASTQPLVRVEGFFAPAASPSFGSRGLP